MPLTAPSRLPSRLNSAPFTCHQRLSIPALQMYSAACSSAEKADAVSALLAAMLAADKWVLAPSEIGVDAKPWLCRPQPAWRAMLC